METSKAKLCLETLAILHIMVGLLLPFLVDTWLFNYYNNHLLDAFHANTPEGLELAKFTISLLGPSQIGAYYFYFWFAMHTNVDHVRPSMSCSLRQSPGPYMIFSYL
jgi:hypothetical protein